MNPFLVDFHSHLFAGVDDGASSIEESLALCQQLASYGYQKVIVTPHIHSELYPNSPDQIQRAYLDLVHHPQFQTMGLEVFYAAEYFCDEVFYDSVLAEQPLLTYSNHTGQYILVELSPLFFPSVFLPVVKMLQKKGITVILAHPERCRYVWKEPERCIIWRKQGIWLQVDLLSFHPAYSRPAREIAYWLLEQNQVDLIGTDLHHTSQLGQMQELFQNKEWLQKIKRCSTIKNTSL